jgi:D-galactarolactone cycloisomerase
MIDVVSVESFVFRYLLQTPVQTSFGTMHDRPMVLVSIRDQDGFVGWGEVWCNFPNVGAEHRARLIDSVFAPHLTSNKFDGPEAAFDHLTKATWVLAIQTGEYGPIAQCIAGLDIAIHDLAAKRAQKSLWQQLGGPRDAVPVYASGINPTKPEIIAEQALSAGYPGLNLKIGFGQATDLANLAKLRDLLGASGKLMADANQAWSVQDACENVAALAEFDLFWLEEPMAADRPQAEWQQLADCARMSLAGGENIVGDADFDRTLKARVLTVVQPDLAKWGGLTKCVPLGSRTISAGLNYCPHYLGGGIGLVASAHALAAAGGEGMLEVDINANPLRSELVGEMLSRTPGMATLSTKAGLGVEPDLGWLKTYRVSH